MSGAEKILEILSDRQPHLLEEIEARCGGRVTVHSRVADLRRDGWVIVRVNRGRMTGYQLVGKKEGSYTVREKDKPPVQGYMFESVDSSDPRNGTICHIVAREAASDHELLEAGPGFRVRFGDGDEDIVFGSELSPWYPT